MPHLDSTQKIILELSKRIIYAQKPIRILDSIKWNEKIQNDFFAHHCKKLPAVDRDYYLEQHPLPFDPEKKIMEFFAIEHDLKQKLGPYSSISRFMQRICREYRDVIHLLYARGTKEFHEISQDLYGSSDDALYPGSPTMKDLSHIINNVLMKINTQVENELDKKIYTAEEAAQLLKKRLLKYFGNDAKIDVTVSDELIPDAAAGADTIKLRSQVMFSERDIRLLEVHEGWVHLGTTLNGLQQPICTFLGKGPPSSIVTQEGLAMFVEIVTFSSYPDRVQRINNRVIAISMAEQGADFLDVFNFFKEQGLSDDRSYHNTVRVFRGSTPTLGPFTKDLSYSKGFVLIYNFVRLSIQAGKLDKIPLLFVGKINLDDMHLLAELYEEKLIYPPQYVPPHFSDLAALSSWMSYSLFLNKVNLDQMAQSFKNIV